MQDREKMILSSYIFFYMPVSTVKSQIKYFWLQIVNKLFKKKTRKKQNITIN